MLEVNEDRGLLELMEGRRTREDPLETLNNLRHGDIDLLAGGILHGDDDLLSGHGNVLSSTAHGAGESGGKGRDCATSGMKIARKCTTINNNETKNKGAGLVNKVERKKVTVFFSFHSISS